jgi:hypothetical protein
MKEFEKAGLVAKFVNEPFIHGRGMEEIVQIDIQRQFKKGAGIRTEYFRIYKPEGAIFQVRDIDQDHNQLVLLVKEGAREFEEAQEYSKWQKKDFDTWSQDILAGMTPRNRRKVKVIRPNSDGKGGKLIFPRKTTAQARYFLMGVDERQLFIAQTQGAVTTVAEARKSLGRSVQFAEGKKNTSPDRQGEWFFVETTEAERKAIENGIKSGETIIHKKMAIGQAFNRRGGNPHTADEIAVVARIEPQLAHGHPVRSRASVYVRGKIRHPDHKTVKFTHWRKVIANSEGATATGSASGVFWVD